MIDISPYKFKKLHSKQEFVHVCPCPDTYRGLHRGNDEAHLSSLYVNEFTKIVNDAEQDGRGVCSRISIKHFISRRVLLLIPVT